MSNSQALQTAMNDDDDYPYTPQVGPGPYYGAPKPIPYEKLPDAIGDLKTFRQYHGLTQEEMATLVGKSRATINAWENKGGIDRTAAMLIQSMGHWPTNRVRQTLYRAQELQKKGFLEWLKHSVTGKKSVPMSDDPASDYRYVFEEIAKRTFALSELAEIARLDSMSGAPLIPDPRPTNPLSPLALQSRLAKLGAQYVPFNPTDVLRLAAFSTLPTPQWLFEGQALTESAAPLRGVQPAIKTLGVATSVSRYLLSATDNEAEVHILRVMLEAIMRAMDTAAVLGGGGDTAEPIGLLNLPSLPVLDATAESLVTPPSGPLLTIQAWAEAQKVLELAGINSARLGVLASPETKHYLSLGVDWQDGTLWRVTPSGDTCGGRPALTFNGIPEKTLLIGDFSHLTIRHSNTAELKLRETDPSGKHELFMFAECCIEIHYPTAFLRLDNVW